MDKLEKDAIAAGSSPDKKGANDEGSPTPEQLRAAQDSAEVFRKELDDVKERLEEKESKLEELNAKIKADEATAVEKRKAELLKAGITDDEALVAELEGLAAKGDVTARAYLRKMEKIAEAVADKKVKEHLTKAELERDFDRRDELVEVKLEEWNKGKEKADVLTAAKFKEAVGAYADPGLASNPSKQFRQAYDLFVERENFKREKAEHEAEKLKNGQFRDSGTSSDKGGGKKAQLNWRDAKTPQEKDALLKTL